jgi:serine protease
MNALSKLKSLLFLPFFIVLLMPTLALAQPNSTTVDRYIPGKLMIKLETENQIRQKGIPGAGSSFDILQEVEAQLRVFGLEAMDRVMTDFAFEELRGQNRMRMLPGQNQNNFPDDLTRTFQVTYSSSVDPLFVASKLASIPGVDYAEPMFIYETTSVPNDPLYGTPGHSYFEFQNFPAAWEVTTSSEDIIIAIVDSGTDYNHPDLAGKMWRNPEPGRARTLFPNIFNAVVNDTIGWNFWESGPASNPVQNGNPMGTGSSHGTHVAGTAAAVTNNGIGISGAGYNSSYMVVRAGGTLTEPTSIGFGAQGILYAAVNGAHVINCSFGGSNFSDFANDVVNFATALGSIVVASAGNNNTEVLNYPASYENAFSVASVLNFSGVKSGFSTYNYEVDVAATGSSILSTVFNGQYATFSGTSMSAPIVSGLAALLVHQYPDWSPGRIKGQIRNSANLNLYDANPEYLYKLGGGLIDAGKALSTPMPIPQIVSTRFVDANGDKLGLDTPGMAQIRITNVGATSQSLAFRAMQMDDKSTLTSANGSIGSIGIGDTVTVEIALRLGSNLQPGDVPQFIMLFDDNSLDYSGYESFDYNNIYYDTHNANMVRTSISATGSVGSDLGSSTATGIGFIPKVIENGEVVELPNVLYESGVIIEYNYDNTRFLMSSVRTTNVRANQFKPIELFQIETLSDGSESGFARFNSDRISTFPKMDVEMRTYALNDPDQGIFVYFTVTNNATENFAFNDVYIGMYSDWDIANFQTNSIKWSEPDSIMIAYSLSPGNPYVTSAHLGGISSALAINNAYTGPVDSLNFGVYYSSTDENLDGFPNHQKSASLKAQRNKTEQNNTDISMVTASGPFTIRQGESVTVGFFYGFGTSEADLRDQVARAREEGPMETSLNFNAPRVPVIIPTETALLQNYPNPFNPQTTIIVDNARLGQVKIEIYDVLGRKVATAYEGFMRNRRIEVPFDASGLASGQYLIVFTNEIEIKTRLMTVLK